MTFGGPLRAVILDWAGTTIDHGCLAPALAFVQLFENFAVPITVEQARRPMGIHKREHIRAILQFPDVRQRWQLGHGHGPTEQDVHLMFERFLPIQLQALGKRSMLIPGTVEAVSEFRRRGLKVGATTGYTREMMQFVEPEAARQGYSPDVSIAADEVSVGRPYPWIFPLASVVKVGDTVPDIEEGLNAGMWTIGLSVTGNEMGLSESQLLEADDTDLAKKKTAAVQKLRSAGAHYVVDSIRDVPRILDRINEHLREGMKP
jgi:phosphonoacetaldehyde hydrolase